MPAPELPEELAASRDVEWNPAEERARLREYGDRLREQAERRRAADEAEWRRNRIPVGIIWRDPRDLQGLGILALDDEERELLALIRKHRKEKS